MHSFSSSLIIMMVTASVLLLSISTGINAAPVFAGVRRDTSHFATAELRSRFATSVVTSLASMIETTRTTTTLPPSGGKTARERLIEAIGSVETVDVAEVNDTFTNVQLECSNGMTANAIIEAANVVSWNAIKSSGIVLASVQGPQAETQGARTVVFFAIVVIVAVVCAGLASWCVRRRAIEKHRGISFTDLAGLEEELYRRQEDTVQQRNSNNNNTNGVLGVPMKNNNTGKQQMTSSSPGNNTRGNTSSSMTKKPSSSRRDDGGRSGGNNNSSSRRR